MEKIWQQYQFWPLTLRRSKLSLHNAIEDRYCFRWSSYWNFRHGNCLRLAPLGHNKAYVLIRASNIRRWLMRIVLWSKKEVCQISLGAVKRADSISNVYTIRQFKVPVSWLRDFARSYENTSFSDIETGPRLFGGEEQSLESHEDEIVMSILYLLLH